MRHLRTPVSIALNFFLLLWAPGCEPTPPAAPEGFVIHPDFRLEQVAGEPLVYDPVALQFDETGRAFVLEMPGYPLEDEQSRLILLQDEDGDGQFDQRIVFAEGLNLASSFLPYRGGFLVAAPPNLLFIQDTDGDHHADRRDILMDGFSTGNLQHNFNGLSYGLDNWLYAANGGNSGKPYFVNQVDQPLDLRGDDFRFRLEPPQMSRIGESSGGFGLAFDHWGHLYETHNLEHVSHLVMEGRYLDGLPVSSHHSLSNISDHEENGLSRIYPIGEQDTRVNHPEQSGYFSGACGITFYGGGAFPKGFNDNLFVADVVLNLIHLDVLSANKASMKTSRMREKAEFLASTDRAFRPVNLTTGPDGALYVIDIHREVIEHPEWIPDEMEAKMDLNAGKNQGRIYRITPLDNWQPQTIPFQANDIPSLVAALSHPNQWVRMNAQRLLVESGATEAVALLQTVLTTDEQPYAQLHGLWTLEGLGQLPDNALLNAFRHPQAGVRENALKIAESRLNMAPALTQAVLKLTQDPNERVAMQACLSLSTLDEANFVRFSPSLLPALTQRLSDPQTDLWTSMAITRAVRREPIAFCKQLLATQTGPLNEAQQEVGQTLARYLGLNQDLAGSRQLLLLIQDQGPDLQTTWINALAEGWSTHQTVSRNPGIQSALQTIENQKNAPTSLLKASASLRQAIGLPASQKMNALITQAKSTVLNADQPVEERLAQLQLIALEDYARHPDLLYLLLDNREALLLQREALRQLWEAHDPAIGEKLLNLWPALGPEARRHTGNILLYKPANHDLLLSALEKGTVNLGELNLDLERRRVLLWSEDKSIRQRAESLFSDAGVVQRKDAIEAMRPALTLEGNVSQGKTHFVALCSNCHQYGEIGQRVGPVLTEINRKSKESLLHDMLDPNAAMDTKYLNYQLRTQDGRIFTGIIEQESDTEVQLKMMGGMEITVAKAEIASLTSLGISFMPEGLEGGMEPQDMADLLAFLQQP